MILNNVTATISTRGRTHTTLPLVLMSVANQLQAPAHLIIYDDNDELVDLREDPIYKNIFHIFQNIGIQWRVLQGDRRGQVRNHQRAIHDSSTEWIWRLDDDNVMPADTLQQMMEFAGKKTDIGAVGPLILDPKCVTSHRLSSSKIEDIFLGLNIQWCNTEYHSFIPVEHLQGSTFMFRREAAKHGYNLELSRVGHREETMFTHTMHRMGWKLYVLTGIKTWHMHFANGGIRSEVNSVDLYNHDEQIFRKYLNDFNIRTNDYVFILLDGGIGDHYALRSVLPQIREKRKGKIVIGAAYPQALEDEEDITIVSVDECSRIINADQYNVYGWMDRNNWKYSLAQAYLELYTK